jgi:ubiquinone/menaquinone biosynthesis C-methylase UbiE
LDREVNWSKYAISYDKILLHFDKYLELIKAVVGMAGSAQVCADLGAGTGNVSFELLGASPTREVWAYESNEAMLERMRAKLKKRPEIVDRLFVVKGDALLSLREKGEGEFDAAFMVNSLYAMEDKEFCLREVYRVLKPNGVLVLSTPHNETDVLRLFAAIKACLAGKNLHEELRPHLEDAYARHLQMDQAIHEHTKKSTFQMIEAAGFRIEETIDPAYVGAVVIVRAVKRAEK